jgi:tail protein
MPIPAVPVPPAPPLRGYAPGTVFGDQTCILDDSQGSGHVLTFGQADADRIAWRVTNLVGWDSADIPETAESRTGADGAWDTDNFYDGRQVTVEGLIEAPSRELKDAAKRKLAAATPARGRLVTFTVNEFVPTQVSARRSGRLLTADLTDTVVQFSINLFAPDPRKYGVDLMDGSALLSELAPGVPIPMVLPLVIPEQPGGGDHFAVRNDGDYETPPLIRIVGPGADVGIANLTTGDVLRYQIELSDGDELVIDTLVGAAQLNGAAYRSPAVGSTVTSRFLIPPGESNMQFVGTRTVADVSPLLMFSWRNAWI